MAVRGVRFWRDLYPLLTRFCRGKKVAFNKVVNLAVLQYLEGCGVDDLQVWGEVERLCGEERRLKRVCRTMLRSGSYLPKYADKLFRAPWDYEHDKTSPFNYPRKGDVPLKALSVKEEAVMRRVLARREAIAARIAELLGQVLPKEKFRLAPRRSRSRARDRNKSVNNVRKDDGVM